MSDWGHVFIGLLLLVGGGEAIVRGASGLGLLARLSPAVVGLTIVSAGTSMPELVVSLRGALGDESGIALGNIVGSNIFNIGGVLGVTALVHALRIRGNSVSFEWPVLVLVTSVFLLLVRDGELDRLEGGFLLAGLGVFFSYAVWVARKNTNDEEREEYATGVTTASFGQVGWKAWLFNASAVAVGVALLAVGSNVMVDGAVGVATAFGVSSTVIGLTVVAVGTSTPELITSVVAAVRGKDDIAVTNVLGSNIFNLLGIGGATALLSPMAVSQDMLSRDNWWMLGLSLVLFPLMRSSMRVTRLEGALLLGGYIAFTATLLMDA